MVVLVRLVLIVVEEAIVVGLVLHVVEEDLVVGLLLHDVEEVQQGALLVGLPLHDVEEAECVALLGGKGVGGDDLAAVATMLPRGAEPVLRATSGSSSTSTGFALSAAREAGVENKQPNNEL